MYPVIATEKKCVVVRWNGAYVSFSKIIIGKKLATVMLHKFVHYIDFLGVVITLVITTMN